MAHGVPLFPMVVGEEDWRDMEFIEVGRVLAAHREMAGLTQAEAAEMAGVTRRTYIRWEVEGRAPSRIVDALARAARASAARAVTMADGPIRWTEGGRAVALMAAGIRAARGEEVGFE